MKKTFFYLLPLVALLFLFSCSAKKDYEQKKIEQQETLLMDAAKKGKIDTVAVTKLLEAYEGFADKYPGDSVSANFLFKAADFYRYMHQPLKSISLYEKIYNNFPNSEKRPYALFLQGFIFENAVGNTTSARFKYEEFLKKYPNHPIAKDVQATLSYLGKTPEQMMEEIRLRQQQDSLAAAAGK